MYVTEQRQRQSGLCLLGQGYRLMQIEANRWKQKQVSVQSSLSTNIYCDKLKEI